jgi:hypothetical protein
MVNPFWMGRTGLFQARRRQRGMLLSFRYDHLSSKRKLTGAQLAEENGGL